MGTPEIPYEHLSGPRTLRSRSTSQRSSARSGKAAHEGIEEPPPVGIYLASQAVVDPAPLAPGFDDPGIAEDAELA